MKIEIQITGEPVAAKVSLPAIPHGALAEFRGVVRSEENGEPISALEYEHYSPMAENEMRRILESLAQKHPCLAAKIIHRVGIIPVGETAIYVGIISKHRGEAFTLLAEFMERLKTDVPIWKTRAVSIDKPPASTIQPSHNLQPLTLDQALVEIESHCRTLPAVLVSLDEGANRILREDIFATADSPICDKSTRDGFAILQGDDSEFFQVVDTIFAAGWKPRQLRAGEAVRVATGASLPCENLRVVMQENVEKHDGKIRITRMEDNLNVRRRGEEAKTGDKLLPAGSAMNAGVLSLLASIGCTRPSVSPRLRVMHFTTGDEIVSPEKSLQPGEVRDSNSILIRTLLQKYGCELTQRHLPEDYERAREMVLGFALQDLDLLLVSGGASVGEKDFTRQLMESLGFQIIFDRVKLRPGAPLIFGAKEKPIAFGLPGNPLSHFVCFHFAVATALAKLRGAAAPRFSRGVLAEKMDNAFSARETLWPAVMDAVNGKINLHPLAWNSSSDVAVLAQTNALIRVPAEQRAFSPGAEMEFLLT